MTKCEVFGVYLIDFKINEGGELSNKHYGLVLTKISSSDKTFLVAPMTSKKRNKKYSLDEEDTNKLKVTFHKFFKHLELDMEN